MTETKASGPAVPELSSSIINDSCWKFVETMPHRLPGPIFNDLKPALYAAVCHVLANMKPRPSPAAVRDAAWQDITTAPWADDLIWVRKGDNIDGPKRIQHDDYDRYTHWAPCEPPQPAEHSTFQARVQPWMQECFGAEIAADTQERNHRFLEEALELVQACGCTSSEAHQLVNYVFGRPVGDKAQEVGGVMVTLAALCLAQGMDMHAAGETELARIWTKVEQIRVKQAAKPKHSPLPEQPSASPAALTLDASEVAYLAARLRRLFGHFNYKLPDFATSDGKLIGIAPACIGGVLANLARAQASPAAPSAQEGE